MRNTRPLPVPVVAPSVLSQFCPACTVATQATLEVILIVSLPDPPEAGLEKVVGVTVKVRGVPAAGLMCNR